MDRKCENCYWKRYNKNKFCSLKDENVKEEICDYFDYTCEKCKDTQAYYELDGIKYCKECIYNELGIETYTIEHYQTSNGEYLGNETDDFIDILQKVDNDVKELD